MHRFKELKVWQKSMEIVEEVYKLTGNFPENEKFGLTSQMRRAAVSIPSNIAEGAGRRTNPEFRNFLNYSNGSAAELETQLILSVRLKFLTMEQTETIISDLEQIQNMNFSLMKSLSKS